MKWRRRGVDLRLTYRGGLRRRLVVYRASGHVGERVAHTALPDAGMNQVVDRRPAGLSRSPSVLAAARPRQLRCPPIWHRRPLAASPATSGLR